MVTDQQYRDLLTRMDELENKLNVLSRSMAEMKMKSGLKSTKPQEPDVAKHKDITKYTFEGKKYSKRQLVLEIVKRYILENNIHDVEEIWKIFPDHIQGSLGVIRRAEDAELYEGAIDRYFFRDNELITLNDGVYVVCKDWTAKNIKRFLQIAETLGYTIDIVNRY